MTIYALNPIKLEELIKSSAKLGRTTSNLGSHTDKLNLLAGALGFPNWSLLHKKIVMYRGMGYVERTRSDYEHFVEKLCLAAIKLMPDAQYLFIKVHVREYMNYLFGRFPNTKYYQGSTQLFVDAPAEIYKEFGGYYPAALLDQVARELDQEYLWYEEDIMLDGDYSMND